MRKNKFIKNRSAGFTLVEILLYISIVSIMLTILSIFLFSILQSRTKFETISEVDQSGIQVMQIISQSIRNAKKINTPTQGFFGEILSLDTADIGKTPIVFNSSGVNLQIKEGTGSIIAITNPKIIISNLIFYNTTKNNTPGIIKFQFTLTYNNLSGRNEYDYSKTFYGSASLRYN